ncbi:beta-ketoacyl synthase N-terminal-like domain-containing protein [Paenibacillus sp. sgz500958]|uniref:beta-ketoacyl synthase N-terminal-like domain-containing protein n=1 Tax=Paenibacillus sp. sgz500958 TaxID=3242475 RepID=UPI0036D2293C
MNTTVVISGMGCVTPLGNDPKDVHKAMIQGQTAFSEISQFDSSTYACRFGGEIKNFNIRDLGISGSNIMLRYNKMQMKAVIQTLNDYNLMSSLENNAINCAVYVANHTVNVDSETLQIFRSICSENGNEILDFSLLGDGLNKIPPLSGVKQLTTVPSHFIAKYTGAHGPGNLYYSGDSGSLTSLLSAARAIETGRIEQAVVSASFSPFSPHEFAWWYRTGIIRSTTPGDDPKELVAPFHPQSSGTIMSEGAGAIFLESEESALRNGHPILARICGGSSLTVPGETYFALSGQGFAKTLESAFKKTGLAPNDMDLILCNAPSVSGWDNAELDGLSKVWRESHIRATSTKGYLGFLGPTSGILDVILAVQSMITKTALPLSHPQAVSEKNIDWVHQENTSMEIQHCVINGAGLGGAYCSVILQEGEIH